MAAARPAADPAASPYTEPSPVVVMPPDPTPPTLVNGGAVPPRLIALQSFSSFGVAYELGDEIKAVDYMTWPQEALNNRLKHGSIGYSLV